MLAHSRVVQAEYDPYTPLSVETHFTKRALVLLAIRWRIR